DDVARELFSFWAFGEIEEYYEQEKRISEVSLEQIKELAKKEEYSFYSLGP
ncbi:hypothetical protein H8D91_01235, partial [archaeon]|nr:hypothetical protein [archaeon]